MHDRSQREISDEIRRRIQSLFEEPGDASLLQSRIRQLADDLAEVCMRKSGPVDRSAQEGGLEGERFRAVVEGSPVPTFVIDRNHRIVSWNRALAEYSGIPAEDVLDTSLAWKAFYPEERPTLADLIVDQAIDQIPVWYEGKYAPSALVSDAYEATDFFPQMRGGTWLFFTASPIRDAEGRIIGAVEILQDITERKRSEEALKEYAETLKRSNEDLERFAYAASHDLQEPLRTIVVFSQLLEKRYAGQLDRDANEYIRFVVDAGRRMQELIDDLLEFSRVTTRGATFTRTDAEGVLQGVLENLRTTLDEQGASITYGALPPVMADAVQLGQVFQNLISNAVKFRRPDVPPVIRISARRQDRMVQFSVQDNGIRIEPRYFGRIFVIFQRLHDREKYPGTGIGLALVKRIVERHGGCVWVESEPGVGSTFHFTIPACG